MFSVAIRILDKVVFRVIQVKLRSNLLSVVVGKKDR
jgi:hypothetical protein